MFDCIRNIFCKMNAGAAVAVLFVLAKGSVSSFESRNYDSEPAQRIVGGEPTTIQNIPYQLSFRTHRRHFCGASILNTFYALTAAHCCRAHLWVGLQVTSGSTNRDSGEPHPVRDVYIHPKYNSFLTDYDVCVLRVAAPFVWGPTTQPVRLVPPGMKPFGLEPAVVSGWGSVKEGGPDSHQLLTATVNVVPLKICNAMYGFQLTARMMCAGRLGGNKDSCHGDSGGPLRKVTTGHQMGIVSWGFGCADPRYPGVYTDIANPEIHSFIVSISLL